MWYDEYWIVTIIYLDVELAINHNRRWWKKVILHLTEEHETLEDAIEEILLEKWLIDWKESVIGWIENLQCSWYYEDN